MLTKEFTSPESDSLAELKDKLEKDNDCRDSYINAVEYIKDYGLMLYIKGYRQALADIGENTK